MTWTMTGQMAVFVAILVAAAFAYLKWLTWDFDRRYGKPERREPAE